MRKVRATAIVFIAALILSGCAADGETNLVPSPTPTTTAATGASPLGFRQVVDVTAGSKGRSTPPATGPSGSASLPIQVVNLREAFNQLDCTSPDRVDVSNIDPTKPMVTCSADGSTKYYLDAETVSGNDVETASASEGWEAGGEWVVSLQFNEQGTKDLASVTTQVRNEQGAANQLAIVVDGRVVSAPVIQEPIFQGQAEVYSNFSKEAASSLAARLGK